MKPDKSKISLRKLFTFDREQRRGILLLLPLIAVISLVIAMAGKPSFEKSFLDIADAADDGYNTWQTGGIYRSDVAGQTISGEAVEHAAELFPFDPNTVTLSELCRLGFSTRTAAGIIKYRERGKRFEIPEDFATCYGVTLEDFDRLHSYIEIGEEFRVRTSGRNYPVNSGSESRNNNASQIVQISEPFDPNTLDAEGFTLLGFSPAQAGVIIRYRESMGGFRSSADLARCYVVSDEMMEILESWIEIASGTEDAKTEFSHTTAASSGARTRVELNSADSLELITVSGIGPVLSSRIIRYRDALGGFHDKSQLAEIQGMTEANYERISEQISIDTFLIRKIDINFATHKTLTDRLGGHPYMTGPVLRKILKNRQLKGGWSSIGDMVKDNTLTQKQAEQLAPYLVFNTH